MIATNDSTTRPNHSFRRAAAAVCLTLAAALYPPAASLAYHGVVAVFNFFAADAFYYLTIARNASWALPTSFDGVAPTNGFHPLWQYLLIVVLKLAGQDQTRQLLAAYLACCATWAAGLGLAAYAVHRLTRSIFAPLWLAPGLLFVFFHNSSNLGYTFSAWAFINGMESPLSFFFGGALLAMLASRAAMQAEPPPPPWSDRFCLGLGCVALACVLARLDDIFLIPALWLYAQLYVKGRRRRAALLMTLPTVLGLCLYFAANLLQGLPPLPISGQHKAGFALLHNLAALFHNTIYPLVLADQSYFTVHYFRRTALLLIPLVVTGGLLAAWRRRTDSPGGSSAEPWRILGPLLVYCALKLLYNLANVQLLNQGYWYFALIVLILDATLVALVHNLLGQYLKRAALLLAGLWICLYLVDSYALLIDASNTRNPFYVTWGARAEVRARLLAADPDIKLIDFSDGVIAYALELPTISGTGLAADPEGFKALKAGHYIEYCIARGYDVRAAAHSLDAWAVDQSYITADLYTHQPTGLTFQKLQIPPRSRP